MKNDSMKYTYDYIRVRVSPEERAMLESMVESGEVSQLSGALRKLAFENRSIGDVTEMGQQYLQHIAELHQEIRKLIYAQLENKALYEHDLIRMERALAALIQDSVPLAKAIRSVI